MSLVGGIERLRRRLGDDTGIGSGSQDLRHYRDKVAAVNALESNLRRASEDQLREGADYLRQRAQTEAAPDSIIIELFALVREVARREVGMRPFDVQIIGGLDPYREFLKLAAESFEQTLEDINERAVACFASLELSSDELSFEKMGLQGPSSTWTYLVNDHAFSDRLAANLVGGRNVGFAAGAAMTGPLLVLWAYSRRIGRWRRRGR